MADNDTTSPAPVATNNFATTERPAPRTDLDFEKYRKVLLDQKALIEETLASMEDADKGELLDSGGRDRNELSTADNHPADLGTDVQLRGQDLALEANEREVLNKIERALQKIEEGTYGLSDRSYQPIPVERLEAVPYAVLTVEEQSAEEIAG
jgi:RNA polymerase-binding transcription factor DksA